MSYEVPDTGIHLSSREQLKRVTLTSNILTGGCGSIAEWAGLTLAAEDSVGKQVSFPIAPMIELGE